MEPAVSVIVPNYNHARYLRQRIDSILAQTHTDFELILLDDCSTDGSREVLLSYKDNPHITAIILNDHNTGSPFKQWIKGIKEAKGKYIWIAESDDYSDPDFLKETTALLDSDMEANICLTGSWVVNENNENVDNKYRHVDLWTADGKAYTIDSERYISHYMSSVNTIYNGSMVLFRREKCLEGIDMAFANMRYAGDWLFWIEQIKKGKHVIELHKKLNFWRKHTSNTTQTGFDNFSFFPEITYIIGNLMETAIKDSAFHKLIAKNALYRLVKNSKALTDDRRQELFELLRNRYNVRYHHYLIGHWCREFKKHVLLKIKR